MSFARSGPFESRNQDKIIGLFFVLALVAIFYLAFVEKFRGQDSGESVDLEAILTRSFGITESAVVELSGIAIGKVNQVKLLPDATVKIRLSLDQQYAPMYRRDSALKVDTELGLDTVLSGARLEFIPGKQAQLLQSGDRITIDEPKTLDDLLKEWKVEKLARQVREIVANMEKVSNNLAQRQQDMTAIMQNISRFSGELVTIGQKVPPLLENINRTNDELQKSIRSIDQSVVTLTGPLQQSFDDADKLLVAASQTMVALKPSVDRMPELILSLNETAQSINRLSNQLSNHWLLSGTKKKTEAQPQVRLMHDDSLYQ